MRLSSRIKLVLALWFIGEALVFALVAQVIGYPLAFLAAVGTSFLGIVMLKRAGSTAMTRFRATVEGRRVGVEPPGRVLDDALATLGALALVLPGFLSDVIGVALAVPALRSRAVAWVDRTGLGPFRPANPHRHGPSTIDLTPEEWERADGAGRTTPTRQV